MTVFSYFKYDSVSHTNPISMMSEATSEQQIDDINEQRKRDLARMKKVGTKHATTVLLAMTAWGVADYWASESGLLLAEVIALLNALFVGITISSIAHEWGHFSGARMSGSASPVMKKPVSFFMFTFKDDVNSREQFLVMSMGGPIANWILVVSLFFLLPLETWSQALLLATTFAIAVSVCVFELPVINSVMYGEHPEETVQRRLREIGNTSRISGIVSGVALWLLVI